MSFQAIPMFPGDLFDTSQRLAGSAQPQADRPAERPAGSPLCSEKWRQMLDLGWQGVLIAEAHGGVGGSLGDLAAIVEAAARHAWAVPLIDRCAVAPVLLGAAADQPGVRELLEALTVGDASVCPVLDTAGALPGPAGTLRLGADGGLRGTLAGADLSEPASHLVIGTQEAGSGAPVLLLVATARVLERARWYQGIDGRLTADLALDGLPADAVQVLLRGPAVSAAQAAALRAGSLMTCVQAVGAAGAMIEQTIEYLSTRTQFDVVLSSFQALRHRVVEMYVAYENASGLVRRLVASTTGDSGSAYTRDVALAKLYLADASQRVAEAAIQLHGGMGMTWETPAARLAMHALMGSQQYGDKSQCLDWLAGQALADAPAA